MVKHRVEDRMAMWTLNVGLLRQIHPHKDRLGASSVEEALSNALFVKFMAMT